jgi:small-conductance mechanosensitive channel
VTAVLGFALQDTIKNFFAGLTVSLERTFRQGDWVSFHHNASSSLVGEIIEIGWRSTRVRTRNNDYVVVPNSQFITGELTNYNAPACQHARELVLQVKDAIGPERVKNALASAAVGADGVLAEPIPQVLVKDWKADQIVYSLRFWVERFEDEEETRSCVLERVWQTLDDAGIVSTAVKSPDEA